MKIFDNILNQASSNSKSKIKPKSKINAENPTNNISNS